MPRYTDPPIPFDEARARIARALTTLRPTDFDAAWLGGPPILYPSPDGRKWDIFLGLLWSKDGAGAAAVRETLGDVFGTELTERLADFRLPPDGTALLRAAGEQRDLETAAYTMADLDTLIEKSSTCNCVLLTPSMYMTIANMELLADVYGPSGGVFRKRPESFFNAMLGYDFVPKTPDNSGHVQRYASPFTSISAIAALA
jgi:hypothetical protein